MPIDTATLTRLDPNKSYYLSNTTGEIKEAGVIQWFRCLLGVGGGRAKAAALAERVKSALLAEAAATSDSQLDAEIGALDTTSSLSGRQLKAIAGKFSIKLAARRAVENYADTRVNKMAEEGVCVHPDPVSKEFMKKTLVYACGSIIQAADTECRSDDAANDYVNEKKNNVINPRFWNSITKAAQFAKDNIPDFPVEMQADDWPVFKLDELHFRVFLCCMFDENNKLDMLHLEERLARLTENDIQSLKDEILAIPLKSPTDPNAIPEFRKAMDDLFFYHRPVQGVGSGAQRGGDPRNIENMG